MGEGGKNRLAAGRGSDAKVGWDGGKKQVTEGLGLWGLLFEAGTLGAGFGGGF